LSVREASIHETRRTKDEYRDLRRDLRKVATKARAKVNQWFFKTGPGDYGEGDRFLGVTVPALRELARRYQTLSIEDVRRLVRSSWHEERLLGLLILTRQYAAADSRGRSAIYAFYLRNTDRINNWDLVDASADRIVGAHLLTRDRSCLRRLAKSDLLWERRIAMIATFHFIKRREHDDALAVAALLVNDRHDLIQKAVGWMLREIGKRDPAIEKRFLDKHAAAMPRTMLRYAVERFPQGERRKYLQMRGLGRQR
jgi:3-methyladenine DNA glycosylase AlkD